MNRSWPVHASVILCCLFLPQRLLCQSDPVSVAAASGALRTATADLPRGIAENPDIPPAMQDLMRSVQQHYLQGSSLIKSGEGAKARVEFNKAVELLLQSEWNIESNREFNRYFQDIIRRIQQDESRYLQPQEASEEKPESAVVDELSKLDLIPIKVDPSLKDVVEADLAGAKFDIPITVNERVLQSLNFWLSRGRKYFHDGLIRSGRYREMIERTFREESIPLDLMYLAQVESLFKTNALSKARARGIWQFGKWTAVRYGLKVNSYIDERSDPEKATRAAAKYLNDLYAMFKDWNLVLAAYNWGEGRVQRLIDRSGLNDFWEMMDLRRNFPKETKNHVPLIQASIIIARNPEKYGFSNEKDSPESSDRIGIPHAIDLRSAAKILGTSLDDLKRLNPALRGLSTPPDYPGFELKVPPGRDPEILDKVAALPAAKLRPPAEFTARHKVQPGDTLLRIATKYHVSVKSLQDANGIKSPKVLRVGSVLRVPVIRARPAPARSAAAKPKPKPGAKQVAAGSAGKSQALTKNKIVPSSKTPRAKTKTASAAVKKPAKPNS